MPARLSAFIVWALVAASVVFWGLRLLSRPPAAPAHTIAVSADGASARVDLSRLFGAPQVAVAEAAPPPAMAARFQLLGVMAPKQPGDQGLALIAVDGKMPRAYRVGAPIDSDLVLQQVSLRTASIGPRSGGAAVVLELPVLPPPATGSLAQMGFAAPSPPPPPPPAVVPLPQVAPAGQVPQRGSRGMGFVPPNLQNAPRPQVPQMPPQQVQPQQLQQQQLQQQQLQQQQLQQQQQMQLLQQQQMQQMQMQQQQMQMQQQQQPQMQNEPTENADQAPVTQ